jgi:hypothetical protein
MEASPASTCSARPHRRRSTVNPRWVLFLLVASRPLDQHPMDLKKPLN